MKKITFILLSLILPFAAYGIGPITGMLSLCSGYSTPLSDTSPGGTWSSSNTAVATIGSSSGVVSGVIAGTAVISYHLSGSVATATVTVNPSPDPISGVTTICLGFTTSVSDLTPGGTWSSSNASIAAAGLSTGIVSGMSLGIATISYRLPTGCYITVPATVYPNPAAIGGTLSVCVGATSVITDATSGGTWLSSNNLVASVASLSGVTGVSLGTAIITYTLATGCFSTAVVTVTVLPTAITGPDSVCTGSMVTLTNGTPGGAWSSSNIAVGSVGASTGLFHGVSPGIVIITYTVGSLCPAVRVEHVLASPMPITGGGIMCVGSILPLADGTSGGTWSTGSSGTVTVGSVSGNVSAVSAGTAIISYKLNDGCFATQTVAASFVETGIMGPSSLCVGATGTLIDEASPLGVWSSSNSLVIAIGSSTGVVTGVSAGTASITYSLSSGCYGTKIVTVIPSPVAISGPSAVCVGATITVSDGSFGGTWTSSNASVASVGSMSGIVSGIALGTSVITYKIFNGCFSTEPIIVISAPALISGASAICSGSMETLTDGIPGGIWTSNRTSVASVGSLDGVVTGVSPGTAVIDYSLGTGCSTYRTFTVVPGAAPIAGPPTICISNPIYVTDITLGGTWSSSNSSVASVGSLAALVTGVSAGTVTITYKVSSGCFSTLLISILSVPDNIDGSSELCIEATMTLGDASPGGSWYSSNTGVALVGSATGIMFGVSAGTVIISYTLATGCYATRTEVVLPIPAAITGIPNFCAGSTVAFSDLTPGGAWSSNATGVATVGSSGSVSGISTGTAIITYATGECFATMVVNIIPTPPSLTGPTTLCPGQTDTLSDLVSGGSWTSGNLSIGAVAVTGIVTGISAGTVIITYTLSAGCLVTDVMTMRASPAPLTGSASLCAGATGSLVETTTGGIWSSNDAMVASVGTGGVVSALAPGTATIYYTLSTGCYASVIETVHLSPVPITGPTLECDMETLTDSTFGGIWSSSNSAVAIAGSESGTITAISAGTIIVTYAMPTGCYVTRVVSVNFTPVAGTISGVLHQCVGDSSALYESESGGVWSSSGSLTSAVNAMGHVTGIGGGIDTIFYTVTTACGSITASAADTVYALPVVDSILGADTVCEGDTIRVLDSAFTGSWSSSDTTIATVDYTGMIVGITSGAANISYTVTTPCGSVSAVIALAVNPAALCNTGVKAIPTDIAEVTVEPNPGRGTFIVKGAIGTHNEAVTLVITNMIGQVVYIKTIRPVKGRINEPVVLDQSLSAGDYLLDIHTGAINKVIRVVLER